MIYFNTKILILITFIFTVFIVNSQTVNTGEMTILPGTEVGTLFDFNNTEDGTLINDGDFYVYANFNNDGIVDFLGETGATRFVGDAIQTISGTQQSNFYDALFFNPSYQDAFELSSVISITDIGKFSDGVVNAEDFNGLVVFEQGAEHIEVSDDSHVDGKVRKIGNEFFEFPIGDAGYFRHADIYRATFLTDHYTAQYKYTNSNSLYPHQNKEDGIELIDTNEYWIINRTEGDSNLFVTLSWDLDTTPALLTQNNENLHVVRWDPNQGSDGLWVDEGGVVDADNKIVTTIAEVETFGIFTLAIVSITPDISDPFEISIPNVFTPNADSVNDYFQIENIDSPSVLESTVKIYNRWGNIVYETKNYGKNNNVFKGFSNGRLTIQEEELLPTGTYFYIIEYTNSEDGKERKEVGWLYLQK